MQRIETTFLKRCSTLLSEIKAAEFSPDVTVRDNLDGMEQLLGNIRDMDIPGLRSVVKGELVGRKKAIELNQIVTDVVEFRRCADSVVIDLMVVGKIKPDSVILTELRGFWADERFLAQRFSAELTALAAASQTKQAER